ncbi:hypothetical protein PHMEG_00016726 [Phytophthora megakarya]|uniref:Polyprotein n=1 Tax=Phytophthora megakarya TaxID=4795 RepID=A0A225VZN3_9STRA|nr:hypothetical protein PHMEG_00016726 [Phytophthora megakarya]
MIVASTCVEDLMWARKLIKEMTGRSQPCSTLHADNQSTITVVSEHGNCKRMKSFAKHSRKIVELVEKQKLTVQYVPSAENIADIFMKTLGPQRFQGLRKLLNVEDVSAAVQGQSE